MTDDADKVFGIGYAVFSAAMFLGSVITGKTLFMDRPGWRGVARRDQPIFYWVTVAGYLIGAAFGVWLAVRANSN